MRYPRCSMCVAMGMVLVVGSLLAMAPSNKAELCGVDPSDPESMNCNAGFSSTLFTTTSARVVPGLSYDFYNRTCPDYKTIIQSLVQPAVVANPLQAAGIVRIMFHDCFVKGCDASLLLENSSGEQASTPNLSLRPESLQLLDDVKSKLEEKCPNVVSCADIISVAAATAIQHVQGPTINVPVGRRDSTDRASNDLVGSHLPSPSQNVSEMQPIFTTAGLDYTDMVALSGAHTLGEAHCGSFTKRLRPVVDANLDTSLASTLKALCPINQNTGSHAMDATPQIFDNRYFKDVLTGDVLLTSDASLVLDPNTKNLVSQYAKNQNSFNSQFILSFIKMSQNNVLTGTAGEVRKLCGVVNGFQSS